MTPNGPSNEDSFPTPWQKKTIWSALTSMAVVTIGGIGAGGIWLVAQVLSFLQPILIPFAVAGVLAYLLEPVVSKMRSWGIPRHYSVLSVFALVTALLLWGAIVVIPAVSHQTVRLIEKVPVYTQRATLQINEARDKIQKFGHLFGVELLLPAPDGPEEEPSADPNKPAAKAAPKFEELIDLQQFMKGDWIKNSITLLVNNSIRVIRGSVGGFLSVFGFLLSLIIIPIYLYYFLTDAQTISESWQDYLPLRNSDFKTEVVTTLTEINNYVIAFFRGQLLVSLINGSATTLGLVIVGLDFGLLIGLVLCILGLIPYVGILCCWIPAVIIASVQGGAGTWIPSSPGWLFPLVVTCIFIVVQKIDSFFITPKVVSSRVGLHPMTVIVALFSWSLIIGGLLGTILAIPLTATLKVLLRRYIWERRILGKTPTPGLSEPQNPAPTA